MSLKYGVFIKSGKMESNMEKCEEWTACSSICLSLSYIVRRNMDRLRKDIPC